jgi:hypothetical protein
MVKMMDNKIDRLDDHFASLVERSMEYGYTRLQRSSNLELTSNGSQRIVYWSVPHCIDKYFFHIMTISSFISLNFNQNDICLDILVLVSEEFTWDEVYTESTRLESRYRLNKIIFPD